MSGHFEDYVKPLMSGDATGAAPALLRAALAMAEPFYASGTALRNRLYDAGVLPARRLPRPVISIGNITTGGTGKTPMVRWLAERLRADGRRLAVLSRGYRSSAATPPDELTMLDRALNSEDRPRIWVRANPDRQAAGLSLLREHPQIDLFVLDDAFQHRRLARDLDVVLVSALEPFGFGRVLPRGLLREPLSGLGRAHAIVIMHADEVALDRLTAIEARVRRHSPNAPVYRARHVQTGLRPSADSASGAPEYPMDQLLRQKFLAFAGIGNPQAFARSLGRFSDRYLGHRWFRDHHTYTREDLEDLQSAARTAGADVLVTTEKDWVKVSGLTHPEDGVPIWRIDLQIEFMQEDEERLLAQVRRAIPGPALTM